MACRYVTCQYVRNQIFSEGERSSRRGPFGHVVGVSLSGDRPQPPRPSRQSRASGIVGGDPDAAEDCDPHDPDRGVSAAGSIAGRMSPAPPIPMTRLVARASASGTTIWAPPKMARTSSRAPPGASVAPCRSSRARRRTSDRACPRGSSWPCCGSRSAAKIAASVSLVGIRGRRRTIRSFAIRGRDSRRRPSSPRTPRHQRRYVDRSPIARLPSSIRSGRPS